MKDYASWYVEIHPYELGIEMSHRIATHLVSRIGGGNAIIVCDMPHNWLPTFRRRWNHVLRLLERERAAALGQDTRAEFTRLISSLRQVRFEVTPPRERSVPTIWLAEPESLDRLPKGIMTIYVMSNLGMSQLLFWARQLPDDGAVLLFRKQPLAATVPT